MNTTLSEQGTLLGTKPLIVLNEPNADPDLRRELESLSLNGRWVSVNNTSHYMIVDRPDAVVAAIHEAVIAARETLKSRD